MMLRSTQLIVLSEVLSLKSLLKNITCLKLFMIILNFLLKNVKLSSLELFRALWNQSTCLSFVEKGPLQ